jgi:hypothetical protein
MQKVENHISEYHYYDNVIAQCDLQIDQQLYENKFLELISLTFYCWYFNNTDLLCSKKCIHGWILF